MARGKQLPTSFTAGRTIRVAGVVYTIGQAIPTAAVGGLNKASALLSRRWIIPANEAYPKKGSTDAKRLAKPKPTTLNPKERRNLGA